MRPLGDPVDHLWLVHRMARAAGLDPARLARRGELDQACWAGMVSRCRACPRVAQCRRWLARSEQDPAGLGRGGAKPVAPTCVNRDTLSALRARSGTGA